MFLMDLLSAADAGKSTEIVPCLAPANDLAERSNGQHCPLNRSRTRRTTNLSRGILTCELLFLLTAFSAGSLLRMATKLITVLEEDLDGTEAEETVSFQLDDTTYEIDLNATHSAELRSILGPYIEAGRKQRSSATAKRTTAWTSGPTTAQVRAWAQEQGIKVNDRGRVGADLLAQYAAAH